VAPRDFRDRLLPRIEQARTVLPSSEELDRLERYIDLLRKWNARINLTGLPLDPPSDEALDRLLVEPLSAAVLAPDSPLDWFDLGSGGGSPAIPLKVIRPALRLIMVESRARKAGFLREVARSLGLAHVRVERARIEEIARRSPGMAQLVTLRAVRVDAGLLDAATRLLSRDGQMILFRTEGRGRAFPDLVEIETVRLPGSALATAYGSRFHVEHTPPREQGG
jgi:16S rRNA (guanine527-N7)-methyltransferase